VRFGGKPKLTKHQQAEARDRLAQGETLVEIARSYNVSHMTISRLAGFYAISPGNLRPQRYAVAMKFGLAILALCEMTNFKVPAGWSGLLFFCAMAAQLISPFNPKSKWPPVPES
jgi:helix-turn-helix resolvase-like protein